MRIWAKVAVALFGKGGQTRRRLKHLPQAASQQELMELQQMLVRAELDAKRRAAFRLMHSRQYEDCLHAWRAIQRQHPDEHAGCEASIARVLLRMRRTEEAIARLEAARRAGANEREVERGLQLARVLGGGQAALAG